jgi:hypothetical protein
MFVHFIGSSSFASDFVSMILRLFEEINSIVISCGGTALELPTTEQEIMKHIPIFFQFVAKYKVSLSITRSMSYHFTSAWSWYLMQSISLHQTIKVFGGCLILSHRKLVSSVLLLILMPAQL